MKLSDNAKEWIKDIGCAVIIAMAILFFIKPTIVKEQSMSNTLLNNDYVFISRQSYTLFGEPQHGDIIVFRSNLTNSNGSKKLLVKHIIGLPGDTLEIRDGSVILNGEILDEPYTRDGYTSSEMDEVTVPEGYIFAMGDNRQNSTDSRSPQVGFIDINRIRGKVVFRLFPVSGFGAM